MQLNTYTPFRGTEKGERREKQTKKNKKNHTQRQKRRKRMRPRGKVEERMRERERGTRNSHNKREKMEMGQMLWTGFSTASPWLVVMGRPGHCSNTFSSETNTPCPEDKHVMMPRG